MLHVIPISTSMILSPDNIRGRTDICLLSSRIEDFTLCEMILPVSINQHILIFLNAKKWDRICEPQVLYNLNQIEKTWIKYRSMHTTEI
jgi:hypothetical protein